MKRRSGLRDDCSGFTIIEVIVACVIIAILGSITIAGFRVWLPRYNLKNAVRELYSNLNEVKIAAIKEHRNCSITFSATPDSYVTSGVTKTVTLSDYGSGVRFLGPLGETFDTSVVTFNSRGFCEFPTATAYAYLTNETNSAYYRVGPTTSGVIRLEKHVSGSTWE